MGLLTKKSVGNRTTKKSRATSSPLVSHGTTLVPGPSWASFERFRVQGASALNQIKLGSVGTLTSQGRQFRILNESDFQHLVGLASEVDRMRRGLRVVHAAVQTVQEHPGQSSINTLVAAALLLSDAPALPTRHRFEALQPETKDWSEWMSEDGVDEVEIDPEAVRRPLTAENTALA